MVLHDQHIHSCYSEDSTEPIISHYNIAKIKGCKYFVTTEHIDYMPSMSGYDWLCDFDSLIKELNTLTIVSSLIKLFYLDILIICLKTHQRQ